MSLEQIQRHDELRVMLGAQQLAFESEPLSLDKIEHDLSVVRSLIASIEAGDENPPADVIAQAEQIVQEHSGSRAEIQQWADIVLDERFHHVSVSHQRRIELFQSPVGVINDAETRGNLAKKFGFQMEALSPVLKAINFWPAIGSKLEQIPVAQGGVEPGVVDWQNLTVTLDHTQFSALFNALNGSSQIDYESCFPHLQPLFDQIKKHKFHLTDEEIGDKKHAGKSPLAVSDILMALTLDKLDADLPPEIKERALQLHMYILDTNVDNTTRYEQYYPELEQLYAQYSQESIIADQIEHALQALSLPPDHPGYIGDIAQLAASQNSVDATIVMHSFDDGHAARFALFTHEKFPDAMSIPTGTHAPHYVKAAGGEVPQFGEADETIAAQLARNYHSRYPHYPDQYGLAQAKPLEPYQIMPPDKRSVDTAGSARETRAQLDALYEVNQRRPLDVVIVTSPQLSARAWSEYYKATRRTDENPDPIVGSIKVVEYKGAYPITDVTKFRKMNGLLFLYAEYAKRLYDLANGPVPQD